MSDENDRDFELCNKVCKQLISKYGYRTPITDYPEKARCVVLVWTASGKIDNGGFSYLFGATLPGDPHYEFTLDALKKIGCDSAYKAMKNALCLFPNCKPPIDEHERILQYKMNKEEIRDEIDSQFWSSIEQITVCLAKYIEKEKLDLTRVGS